MGDHIPIADKIRAEVDAFAKLWRTSPWLAVLLLVGLVAPTDFPWPRFARCGDKALSEDGRDGKNSSVSPRAV